MGRSFLGEQKGVERKTVAFSLRSAPTTLKLNGVEFFSLKNCEKKPSTPGASR